jgi:ElaB/YqjD/DUF883 family membrane-anchored ribosome-binding protein
MYKQTTRNRQSNRLRNDLDKLKDVLAITARDVRGHAKHTLANSYENVKDRSVDAQDRFATYIGGKPFKALGIAMLSGLVLGLAMRKKRRNNSHR